MTYYDLFCPFYGLIMDNQSIYRIKVKICQLLLYILFYSLCLKKNSCAPIHLSTLWWEESASTACKS